VSDERNEDPAQVAPPMASLLRKARNRRREAAGAGEGGAAPAEGEGSRVVESEQHGDALPSAAPGGVGALLRANREQRGLSGSIEEVTDFGDRVIVVFRPDLEPGQEWDEPWPLSDGVDTTSSPCATG